VTVVPVVAATVRTASIVAAWLMASARPKAGGVPVAIAQDAVSNSNPNRRLRSLGAAGKLASWKGSAG
jgi:hypothetical protein